MPDTIELTLIDDADGSVLGRSTMESGALPDTFQVDTTLNIGGDDWSVVEAEPLTRAGREASGSLVLRLRRIEMVDPREILYSLPTICSELPPADGPLLDGSEILLHEDDWRQVELVGRSQEGVVDEELAGVAQVYRDAAVDGGGFEAIHLRRRLAAPLHGAGLTLAELRESFPRTRESRVVFGTSSECVRDSFSFFVTPDLVLYGHSVAENVAVLAAVVMPHEALTPGHDAIRELARRHDLLLVDWCRCRKAAPGDGEFLATLQARLS